MHKIWQKNAHVAHIQEAYIVKIVSVRDKISIQWNNTNPQTFSGTENVMMILACGKLWC